MCVRTDHVPRVYACIRVPKLVMLKAGATRETVRDSCAVQSVRRNRERMKLVLTLVILLGVCACHADDDDEIEINEIDNDESAPREAQRVRNATLAEIFENAVQAYLGEDWDGCVAGFNDALHGYVIIIIVVNIFSFISTRCTLIL